MPILTGQVETENIKELEAFVDDRKLNYMTSETVFSPDSNKNPNFMINASIAIR